MKTSPPLVSIIINNYNYEAFLAQAIESALAQTYAPVEVVVVDDGSADNSRAVIERYAAQYKGRVIPVLKENGGQASALNAGVLASQGDIICFLDADDIYLPEKVAETVAAFEVDDSIEWFFQRSTAFASEVLLESDLTALFEEVADRNLGVSTQTIDFRHALKNAQLPSFAPATSNISVSRSLANKIFPMPEVRGKSGVAISDLYLKLLAVGLSVGRQTERILCLFRRHNNIYSGTAAAGKLKISTEISIATAFWMAQRYPDFKKMGDKLFSRGLGMHLRCTDKDADSQALIDRYLAKVSLPRRLRLYGMAGYYFYRLKRLAPG